MAPTFPATAAGSDSAKENRILRNDCCRTAGLRCRGSARTRAGSHGNKKRGSRGKTQPGSESRLLSGGGQPAPGEEEVRKRDHLLEVFLDQHAKSSPFEAEMAPAPHHACVCTGQQEAARVPGISKQRRRGSGEWEGLGEAGRDGLDVRVLW